MEVPIQPLQRLIEVQPGANLLDALRIVQVPISYSCMAGRCGTCRCRVIAGEVLDSGGRQQNPLDTCDAYVLACQTVLTELCTNPAQSPPMVEVVSVLIREKGVDPARIDADAFYTQPN